MVAGLFYVCMMLYLYGDLAIYAVVVPKTLRDVAWCVCVSLCSFLWCISQLEKISNDPFASCD